MYRFLIFAPLLALAEYVLTTSLIGLLYLTELQLIKANSYDTAAPFLDLDLSITNSIVSSRIYDTRDDFNFKNIKFHFLGEDIPRPPFLWCIFCSAFVLREYVIMLS